jgi:hypothetical protein
VGANGDGGAFQDVHEAPGWCSGWWQVCDRCRGWRARRALLGVAPPPRRRSAMSCSPLPATPPPPRYVPLRKRRAMEEARMRQLRGVSGRRVVAGGSAAL